MFMPWLLGGIARRLGIGFPQPGWTRFALAGAATLAVAVISWHLFERPINDLKRHFPYRFRTSRPTPFPRPPKPARTR
jgi:peptidoglycan/LPS O-acetylase OafA/YrhL